MHGRFRELTRFVMDEDLFCILQIVRKARIGQCARHV
jgi:hypothetical protein